MKTIIKKIDADTMTSEDFREASEILNRGGLVAVGLVPGLGGYSQGYDRLDSRLAAAVASVPSGLYLAEGLVMTSMRSMLSAGSCSRMLP